MARDDGFVFPVFLYCAVVFAKIGKACSIHPSGRYPGHRTRWRRPEADCPWLPCDQFVTPTSTCAQEDRYTCEGGREGLVRKREKWASFKGSVPGDLTSKNAFYVKSLDFLAQCVCVDGHLIDRAVQRIKGWCCTKLRICLCRYQYRNHGMIHVHAFFFVLADV